MRSSLPREPRSGVPLAGAFAMEAQMPFRLVRANYDAKTLRAYVELRDDVPMEAR